MGQKFTDGRAIDLTVPASQVVHFGELYYVEGWTGIAMDEIATADTIRTQAFEVSEAFWYVKFPSALNPAKGAYVYWADRTATFQDGGVNLQATAAVAGDRPAGKVVQVKNAGGYAVIRALN